MLQESDNLEFQVINYILSGNGKSIWGISNTSIQLVRTCLVLNWDKIKRVLTCYIIYIISLFFKTIVHFFNYIFFTYMLCNI